MHSGEITKIKIPTLNEFDFQIKLTETNRSLHTHEIGLHTHNEFELYVNLSGDVSFLVENNLYNLSRGDVIIARPGEYHHCIYRSDAPHKFFWILFNGFISSILSVVDAMSEASSERMWLQWGQSFKCSSTKAVLSGEHTLS